MAPHSSTLSCKIPWMEEPGGLQSIGSLQVGHDWATSLSHIGEGNGNPLQCSCLENPRDRGAWWAAVYGVAQGRTRLKRLSSSSSRVTRIVPSSPTSVVTNSDHSPPRGEREVTRAEKVRENGNWLAIDRSPRGSGMATFHKELRCLIFKLIPCVHSGLHISSLSSLAP